MRALVRGRKPARLLALMRACLRALVRGRKACTAACTNESVPACTGQRQESLHGCMAECASQCTHEQRTYVGLHVSRHVCTHPTCTYLHILHVQYTRLYTILHIRIYTSCTSNLHVSTHPTRATYAFLHILHF